jgi:hypothetical protein
MTDQELKLIWTLLTSIPTLLGGAAYAGWWLKGQLTSSEIAGLRAEIGV